MSLRPAAALLALFLALPPAASARIPAPPGDPEEWRGDERVKELPKRPETFPPEGPAPEETKHNPVDILIRNLRLATPFGPLLFIPLVDTNKDIGLRYGMMPIWAFRDRRGDGIAAVVAPSFRYNRYLKRDYTWRTYFFPGDKELVVTRFNYSTKVNREIFLRYFNREFLGTKYRLNAEFHLLRQGKFSFYGFGPSSADSDQANYSLYKIGEEFTIGIPLAENWFAEATHSNFHYELGDGPIVTLPTLRESFPAEAIVGWKRLINHKAAITYDSTDHPSLPTRGGLMSLSAMTSQNSLGSDYTYQTYATRLKYYHNVREGRVVAVGHMFFEQQQGDRLPFYAQTVVGESTGLRLEGDGRFRDRGRLLLNFETRIRVARAPLLKFFSDVELSPFLDVGTVFSSPGKVRLDRLEPGPGLAARILLRPQVVVTLDIAWRGDKRNFILKVDYPF